MNHASHDSLVTVGYSTRLGQVSEEERELLDLPGVETIALDLLTEEQLIANAGFVDYLIVGAVEPVSRRVIEKMDRVRLIVRRGTGVDNVDIAAATEFGIGVANVPDASVEEVSDHALALVMNLARHITVLDQALRSGDPNPARAMVETAPRFSMLTVGVVGLGRIGTRFVEKASMIFGEVWGFDIAVNAVPNVRCASFENVLAVADAVSVHVPLTAGTHHLFDRRAFELMKPGAFFVNTSRGELVDETALVEALATGHLGGAGLDVLAKDPPAPGHPLLEDNRVIVTGHTAGKGKHASLDLRRRSVEAVVAALAGKYPASMLNPEVWPHAPVPHVRKAIIQPGNTEGDV